jgi:hypothetical protein
MDLFLRPNRIVVPLWLLMDGGVTRTTESAFSKTNKGLYKSQETVYFGTEPLFHPHHPRGWRNGQSASAATLLLLEAGWKVRVYIATAIPTRGGHDDQRRPHGR